MAKRASQKSMASNLRRKKENAADINPRVVKAAPRKRYSSSWWKVRRTWLAVSCGSGGYIRANDTRGPGGTSCEDGAEADRAAENNPTLATMRLSRIWGTQRGFSGKFCLAK